MILEKSLAIAEKTVELLRPDCERIAIAGSIRRRKAEPNDIEIVAIPKPYDIGLFESGIAITVNQWTPVKGILPCKYTQRLLPEGIKLDLFFATPDNWGMIYAIRTGSARFSHEVLACRWARFGYKSKEGILYREGKPYHSREEEDLFGLLGMEFVPPERRI